MRYLLPQLYVDFNSADDATAEEADATFDEADEKARQHWQKIKGSCPQTVIRFAEQEMLHDADIFGPALLPSGEVIVVAQNVATLHADRLNTLMFLYYTPTEEPRIEVPVVSDVFSRVQPHWLWDEFDLLEPKTF